MTAIRVLLVGDRPRLIHRMRAIIASRSIRADVAVFSSNPAVLLTRTWPDLLILQVPSSSASIEAWRRGIMRFRAHHPLSVLALLGDSCPALGHDLAEALADAGTMRRPFGRKRFCSLVDRWSASATTELTRARAA
jgi:hypothetical protein